MKKLLTLLLLSCLGFAYGQQLSLNDRNVLPYYSLGDNELKFPLRVRNHDTIDHRLKVEVEPVMASNHTFQFCWDICYAVGHTYSINGLTVPAGDSMGAFVLYFKANGTKGVSTVKVTFFDEEDPDIRISHLFRISQFGVTSIEPASKSTITPPSPNPASTFTQVEFDLTSPSQQYDLRLYNLLGRELKRITIQPGTSDMQLDVRELRTGIYFVYLHADGKRVTSQKLIVSR